MSVKIQGGFVVAFDGKNHEILDGGCVVYEGNTITFVGFPNDPSCPKAARTVQAEGRLISPGLINLHCIGNIDLQPLRIDVGKVGFPKSRAWFESTKLVWDETDYRTSARFAVAALLRHGSTTFCNVTTMASKRYTDPEIEPKLLAEASQELGARAYNPHNFQDHSRFEENGKTHVIPNPKEGLEGLERAIALIEELRNLNDDTLKGFLFPYTTETCSDELLKAASSTGRELGVPVRSHFAQYPHETISNLKELGMSPVERLANLEVLGPELTLTHAIYLRGHPEIGEGQYEDDLKLLADSGTNVGHTPVVFSRQGINLLSFKSYVDAGVNVALGTDTVPPDLLAEMRMVTTMSKVADADPTSGNAAEVFNSATLGGAKALGRNDIGRLAAGARADISVFDLRGLHIGVVDDPITALIHYANGVDTETVIVDGRTVVENSHVVGLAEAQLQHDAHQAWQRYKLELEARDPEGRNIDDLYPPAFPIRKS